MKVIKTIFYIIGLLFLFYFLVGYYLWNAPEVSGETQTHDADKVGISVSAGEELIITETHEWLGDQTDYTKGTWKTGIKVSVPQTSENTKLEF